MVGILSALVLNHTAFRGNPIPFVMELPNYRFPSAKSVGQLIWDKAKDFLERAFTIIFVATIVIWFLQTFDLKLNVVTDSEKSLLALVGAVDRTAVWTARFFGLEGFYGVDYRIYGKRGGGQHLECVDRHGDCQSKQGARKYVYRALGGKLPCVYAALHAVCCSHCGGEA